MSLAEDLKRAHRERRARMDAAAARARAKAASAAPMAPEPPKRRVALPPALIELLTTDRQIKLPLSVQSAREIIETVSVVTKIPVPELVGQCRLKHLIVPRQVAMWAVLIGIEGATPPWACPFFKRDRATLHHAFARVQSDLICRKHNDLIRAIEMRTGLPLLAIAQHIDPDAPFGGPRGVSGPRRKLDTGPQPAGYGKRIRKKRRRAPVVVVPPRETGGRVPQ